MSGKTVTSHQHASPITCACGRPLHYADWKSFQTMRRLVRREGPTVLVECLGRKYRVQRHYIALHGLVAADLPQLAESGLVTALPPA